MNQSTLLDILIGLIIGLVAVIGLWQGIVRTLLYLGGSLLGSELALWWADDLGDRLADWLPLSVATGRFVSSTLFIIAAMVLVGSGFGPLIRRYPGDWRNRAGGLIAGLGLGTLTIGLVLRYYFVFLRGEAQSALGDTRIASALWSDFNVLVLSIGLGLALMIVVGWILGPPDADFVQEFEAQAAYRGSSVLARSNSYAPSGSRACRSSTAVHELTVHENRQDYDLAPTLTDERQMPHAPAASDHPAHLYDDVPASHHSPLPDAFISRSIGVSDMPEYGAKKSSASEALSFKAEEARDRRESSGICPNCGMLLRQGDAFCPDCGFPVDE
ncbi:MAG: zinc ribbon domain-containing protein [Thermomicrobiales bacterium]